MMQTMQGWGLRHVAVFGFLVPFGYGMADELPPVTVTGTREAVALTQTPAAVGVIDAAVIRRTAPSHPGQLLGQVPGVSVAVTQGEGHTTAIRQPFSTAPVYLFLEDGIPVRATGFFNHNALYEVNLPQAGGIEVTRGPATALYGSDAIGGMVNVLTRTPAAQAGADARLEIGGAGWRRLLVGGDGGRQPWGAVRADINLTQTDGWRAATQYERQSATVRWDAAVDDDTVVQTVLGFANIDQQTGANSPLPWTDYVSRPTLNTRAIAYRQVTALRASSRWERAGSFGLVSVTPYVRDNQMTLLASFNLPSDPTVALTEHRSLGLLTHWRQQWEGVWRPRLIAGVDLEYSPGRRIEDRLTVTTLGSGASRQYLDYQVRGRVYDYQATFSAIAPYVHAELNPLPPLRLTAGLRWDYLTYRLDNAIEQSALRESASGAFYGQVPDMTLDYQHVSPKWSALWQFDALHSGWVGYSHGFRAPSEGQLFRPAVASSAAAAQELAQRAPMLAPIKADQIEIGIRRVQERLSWEWVAYHLVKRDDLVTQRDPLTNVAVPVNAGQTRHNGLETGLGWRMAPQWRWDGALSYARHTYRDWRTATADYSGREIESAPRLLLNARVRWEPTAAGLIELEWVHMGSYWLEASNNPQWGRYDGHDLWHLRGQLRVLPRLALFGRLFNVADTRWADSASVSSNTAVYSPGQPRTAFVGVEAQW